MNGKKLRNLCAVMQADLVLEKKDGKLWPCFDSVQDSPLMQSEQIRQTLRRECGEEGVCLYQGRFGEYFAAFQVGSSWLYLGPMCSEKIAPGRRREFYRSYQVDVEKARVLPAFSLGAIRDRALLVFYALGGETEFLESELEEEDEGEENARKEAILSEDKIRLELQSRMAQLRQDQTLFVMKEEEANDEMAFRHSYHEEQLLMAAVREGRDGDVVRLMEGMDRDEGRLSEEDIHHWKNLAVIGIALCSRAAIEGGVPPEVAYRLSGYYIRKCDEATRIAVCLQYRNQGVTELAGRVKELMDKTRSSNHVERCKDYVRKHYREKIMVEEVAESLGVSAGYLSKLFKKETGRNLQEFINEERVYRASNLLLYSDLSLAEIAEYVHFPTQSYFGQIFKRYKGMTPGAFRSSRRSPEFISRNPGGDKTER